MHDVMVEAGYKETVAQHPKLLTQSQAWQKAMVGIDFPRHLDELDDLASTKKNTDKDNCLKATDMLFKLGDKFPPQKSKIMGLFDTISNLEDE